MRKRIIRWAIFLVLAAITLGTGYATYDYIVNVYSIKSVAAEIPLERQLLIEIPRGAGTEAIANILKEKGVISNVFLFRVFSKLNGYDGTYRSGAHAIDKNENYNTLKGYDILMDILSSKPLTNVGVRVTIPEGYNYLQIVNLLQKENLIDTDVFNMIANTESFDFPFLKNMKNLKQRDNKLEGYLFPDTYEFDPKSGTRERDIILKMLRRFDEIFAPEYYNRVKELGTTIDEIIILASIIEREAKVPEEKPRIAGVFYNRLRNRSSALRKLQSCATVQYILYKRDGKLKEVISVEDEEIDDPYNTYIYEGLPPGPICSPGKDSIEAALYPEEHDYLYFVAKNDGSGEHYFSKTFAEHLSNQLKSQLNAQKAK